MKIHAMVHIYTDVKNFVFQDFQLVPLPELLVSGKSTKKKEVGFALTMSYY